ncbi:MAG: DUF2922 domain-containing protein [Aerococcus sp.]|nr:DUF2922 domain-containing protein [Aerococcus sp.]
MATTTTKHLELQFRNDKNQLKKITLNQPKPDVNADQAKQALETIQQTGGFLDDEGLNLYATVEGAVYVTRTVDDIYQAEQPEEN